jgi:hypothetical protein
MLWVLAQLDPIERRPLQVPAYTKNAKDGSIQCKKHSSDHCSTCFGWKKQLQKSKLDRYRYSITSSKAVLIGITVAG